VGYFGGANSLDLFWYSSQIGYTGTLLWLGLFWAQYKRETESETTLMDGNNQVAMGLYILFNITTFAMHLWLKGMLCDVEYYSYAQGACYDDSYYCGNYYGL
jgi:hypothetical protein